MFCMLFFLSVKSLSLRDTSVQLLSHVRLFVTPWITACQASLSITISRSSLRLTSIESVMPSSHLILCRPLLLLPLIPLSIRVFQWVNSSHEVVIPNTFECCTYSELPGSRETAWICRINDTEATLDPAKAPASVFVSWAQADLCLTPLWKRIIRNRKK